jgi:hypothetical protein
VKGVTEFLKADNEEYGGALWAYRVKGASSGLPARNIAEPTK